MTIYLISLQNPAVFTGGCHWLTEYHDLGPCQSWTGAAASYMRLFSVPSLPFYFLWCDAETRTQLAASPRLPCDLAHCRVLTAGGIKERAGRQAVRRGCSSSCPCSYNVTPAAAAVGSSLTWFLLLLGPDTWISLLLDLFSEFLSFSDPHLSFWFP